MQLLEKTKLRQFIRRPDGKLVRFYLTVPLMLTAATAAQPLGPPDNNHILRAEYKDTFTIDRVTKDNEEDRHPIRYNDNGVPDLRPLNPVSNFFKENKKHFIHVF